MCVWGVGGRVCVSVEEEGEMKGSGQNKWNCSTVNLFDKL